MGRPVGHQQGRQGWPLSPLTLVQSSVGSNSICDRVFRTFFKFSFWNKKKSKLLNQVVKPLVLEIKGDLFGIDSNRSIMMILQQLREM